MEARSESRGWLTVIAGTGLNLALGVLYSWSVVAKVLSSKPAEGGWGLTASQASLPYTVALGVFAVMMVFAGRAQDKLGPRIVASIGGALLGIGLIVASFASQQSMTMMIIGFGVLGGTGIGLGYASATPAAVKWFPAAKKGMITGIVVSGFGLASIYTAPTTQALLGSFGVSQTFLVLGIAFFFITIILSQFLVNPPAGYSPVAATTTSTAGVPAATQREYDWHEMIKISQFYMLWVMYAFASFAGLMIIGHMAKIANTQLSGIDLGFLLVAILAIGNASGRIIAGRVSDKLGRVRTMTLVFLGQAVIMGVLWISGTLWLLILGAFFVGFFYGSNLSLFPATTYDYFGTKNGGVNYGLVFTAWGVGGVFGGQTAGIIFDSTGSYAGAYAVAAGLCVLAAGLSLLTKAPVEAPVHAHEAPPFGMPVTEQ